MNQYWWVRCSSCGQDLRLNVGERRFGKKVKATCHVCGTQTETVVGEVIAEEGGSFVRVDDEDDENHRSNYGNSRCSRSD